jgi:PAS domain S-box-containing protein
MALLGKSLAELPDDAEHFRLGMTSSAPTVRFHRSDEEFDYFRKLFAASEDGQRVERGVVAVRLDAHALRSEVRAATGTAVIGYVAAIILLAVSCWLLLHRHVLQPVGKIGAAVACSREGDATRLSGLTRFSDELNQLAGAWNGLVDRLEREEAERKKAQEALRASEERLRQAMHGANEGLWDWNLLTDEVYYSPGWKSMLGYEEDELAPHLNTFKALLLEEDRERTEGQIRDYLEGRAERYEVEVRMHHKLGYLVSVLARGHAVRNTEGKAVRMIGTHVDLSERKRAEEALRDSEERFREIAENIREVFWMTSADSSQILYLSPAYEEIWGRTCASRYEQPRSWVEAIHPEDRATAHRAAEKNFVEHPNGIEYRIIRPDGSIRWIHDRGFPIRDKSGQPCRVVGIAEDITERKQAEAKLEEAHKRLLEISRQAGMAEVATSVLHNVGNVLNSVNISSNLVVDSLKKSRIANLSKVVALMREHHADLGAFFTTDPKGRRLPDYLAQLAGHLASEQSTNAKELQELSKNIEHIKDIVAVQQSYARVSGVVETIQVSGLVEDALRMNAGGLARHEVRLVREYHPHLPCISVEKHKVLQILVNLIRNAKYACDESAHADKVMTVRVSNGENRVRIAIIDNGVGISPENLTRIFSHGFTTRKEGHGFGLHSGALAAKEIDGSLSVYSEGTGRGATFTLELPLQPLKAIYEE